MNRCEASASFVVIDDPGAPKPFCKDHGSEKMLKKMGVLYRKARGGEKCSQDLSADPDPALSEDSRSKSGGDPKSYQGFRGDLPGQNPKLRKQSGPEYRVRPPKKK